jgi:hypothetical protein
MSSKCGSCVCACDGACDDEFGTVVDDLDENIVAVVLIFALGRDVLLWKTFSICLPDDVGLLLPFLLYKKPHFLNFHIFTSIIL